MRMEFSFHLRGVKTAFDPANAVRARRWMGDFVTMTRRARHIAGRAVAGATTIGVVCGHEKGSG
jgi:hypothetical protein